MTVLEERRVVADLVDRVLAKVDEFRLLHLGIFALNAIEEVLFRVLESHHCTELAIPSPYLEVAGSPVLLLDSVNLEVNTLDAITLAKNLNRSQLIVEGRDQRLARRTLNKLLKKRVGHGVTYRQNSVL
jgi:hypothetical protein